MSTRRKLLAVLLFLAGVLATLLVIALRSRETGPRTDPVRDDEPLPPAPRPSEATESTERRSSLVPASAPGPARPAAPAHVPGPPVKIVGKIGDGKGKGLEAVNVLVYDSRAEAHKPEVLRPNWYECTIHERGRALVVATSEDNCRAEVPLEVLEPDTERHIDLELPARPVLRIHVRDLEGKPLPRFSKDQPLRAKLRAVASVEELPAQLSGQMAMLFASEDPALRLGWGDFEPESQLQRLATTADVDLRVTGRRAKRRRELAMDLVPAFERAGIEGLDDATFEKGLKQLRSVYKQVQDQGPAEVLEPVRKFLSVLGYVAADGSLIEGESPERDLVGTLTLVRPLPLRISLLAGQRLLESRDPVPWTEDLLFKIDLERLAESYVHTYLFASDAKTGARLPGTQASLHVEPLPGGPEDTPDNSRPVSASYGGREAPARLGAPKGWRYPEGDVTTDLDGRADFQAAVAGWCRLTLAAEGHVPLTKWVFVERRTECHLGFFELAPLSSSTLTVLDPEGHPALASFEVRPLLHAKDSEGMLETWKFDSDITGRLALKGIGRQQLLLRSSDPSWALAPVVLDNTLGLVDSTPVHVAAAQHVLLHLPAGLPWNSIVHVAQSLDLPVYEEAFGGKTLIDLWVGDGTYTLRVAEGFTALVTMKFTVAGAPLLVELVR